MQIAVIITVVFLALAALIVGIVLLTRHYEKKRTEEMAGAAKELGLEFFASGHDELLEKLQRFKLFALGHSRMMKNVILGETEVASIAIFDYRYTIGGGKNQSTYLQTIVAMESNRLEIPSFTMRPEHLFDIVGSALGLQDIDFADHPEFSKSFVLKADDESSIRAFFDTPLLDFFAQRRGICFEGRPGHFIYYRAAKTKKGPELRAFLSDGYSVYSAFLERLER